MSNTDAGDAGATGAGKGAADSSARAAAQGRKRKFAFLEVSKWLLLAVAGFLLGDAYNAARDWAMDKPDYLQELAASQKKEFADLHKSLDQIEGSGGRAALRQVQGAVKAIEQTNAGLIQQLVLARRENDTLRKVAGDKAGVSGGYDFMLADAGGIRIDQATVLGLDHVTRNGAYINLTASGQERPLSKLLSAGESVAYTDSQGRACKIVLVSFNSASPGAASFVNGCG